jgi:hypothetical protein
MKPGRPKRGKIASSATNLLEVAAAVIKTRVAVVVAATSVEIDSPGISSRVI